ncbi:MAG TPA: Mth938-like domain-containing protein [Azoarcus taiwanensis]|nr:Mth938-like domain-containing protein [Azoarcus taiwanensis]
MKLHLDTQTNLNLVTGYGAGHLMINKVRHDGNLIVTPSAVSEGWAGSGFDGLVAEDFSRLLEWSPEVVLVGTGSRLRFPPYALLRPLIDAGIGFEIMDLPAACRTYNVLAGEGRAVLAALMFD